MQFLCHLLPLFVWKLILLMYCLQIYIHMCTKCNKCWICLINIMFVFYCIRILYLPSIVEGRDVCYYLKTQQMALSFILQLITTKEKKWKETQNSCHNILCIIIGLAYIISIIVISPFSFFVSTGYTHNCHTNIPKLSITHDHWVPRESAKQKGQCLHL